MKKTGLTFLSCVLLLLITSAHSPAQFIHLGLGYNAAFTGMKGLNEVVDDYNGYRTYLDNEMNKFRSLGGMAIHASAGAAGAVIGIDYSWRRNTNISEGTYNGNEFKRHLRLKQDVFAFNIGGVVADEGAAFSGGLRMELYNPKVLTRIHQPGEEKPDWDLANSPFLHATLGPFAKLYLGPKEMWPACFFVGVYYNYALFKTEMYEVDEYLNGTDYSLLDEPPSRFTSRNNSFGFVFGYGIAFTGN